MEGKPVKLSPSGLATAALLAMACHGVSVKFRDYTPAQLLEIYKRGSSAPNNNPQEVLSKPELELYRAIQQRLQLIRQTNPDFDPANLDLTARQAYVTQRQKQSASAKEGSQNGEGSANVANGRSGNSGDRGNNTGPANGTCSPAEGVAGAASSASTGSNSRTVEQPIGSYHFGPGDSLSGTSRNGAKSRLELPSEVMERLRTQGFQLWDRLPLQAQEELTRLYRNKNGAVEAYKTEYGTSAPVSPRAKKDARTWFAESLAHENVKWAYERRAAGVSGSSPISKLAAAQRTLQLQADRAAYGESIADATRRIRADYSRAVGPELATDFHANLGFQPTKGNRRMSATVGDDLSVSVEALLKEYGPLRNSVYRQMLAFLKKNGFNGELVAIRGAGPWKAAGIALTRTKILIFERPYRNGLETSEGRFLQGNAILAHEIGHTLVPEPHLAPELTLKDPDWWLRERRASELALNLKGLTDFEMRLLNDDIEICQKYYESAIRKERNQFND